MTTLSKHLSLLILLCSTGTMGVAAGGDTTLGSGAPGLKVVVADNPDKFAVYQDEAQTVGAGLQGGYLTRHIRVLADQGYGFQQQRMDVNGLEQLYPFGADSAFTCSGGSWDSPGNWRYLPRGSMRYEMHGDKVVVSADVQKAARLKYHLSGDEEFLGCIKGFVFYWKSFNASRVYWKEISTGVERSAKMPSGVIDIYGVTQGIKKDVGFVVFRKSPGIIHYAPYTHDFIEISL